MWLSLVFMLSHSVVDDSATPWTVALQAPLSVEFSRQEYWSGLPFLSPRLYKKVKVKKSIQNLINQKPLTNLTRYWY